MNKFMVSMLFFVFACRSNSVPGTEELLPPNEDVECTAITSCNAAAQLVDLLTPALVEALTPLLPPGVPGVQGVAGQSVSVEDVVAAVLPLLPLGPTGAQGLSGIQGLAGPAGQSVLLEDVLLAVTPFLPVGPQGVQGNVGSQGPKGDQGAKGDVGNTGPAGAQGPAGVGLSNVSTLSAVRVYSPAVSDFKGVISVNSTAVFVPRSLKVVDGSQGTGFATLEFGSNVCTYQGNNKSIDANAAYVLLSCKDSGGVVLPDMVPGKPFAFTGSITLSIGAGADSSEATQAVAYLQVQ